MKKSPRVRRFIWIPIRRFIQIKKFWTCGKWIFGFCVFSFLVTLREFFLGNFSRFLFVQFYFEYSSIKLLKKTRFVRGRQNFLLNANFSETKHPTKRKNCGPAYKTTEKKCVGSRIKFVVHGLVGRPHNSKQGNVWYCSDI